MDGLLILFIVAVLVEAVWEAAKVPFGGVLDWIEDNTLFEADKSGVAAVGIVICVGTYTDLLSIIGHPLAVPYVGEIFTGLIVARGANAVHDLIQRLEVGRMEKEDSYYNGVKKELGL